MEEITACWVMWGPLTDTLACSARFCVVSEDLSSPSLPLCRPLTCSQAPSSLSFFFAPLPLPPLSFPPTHRPVCSDELLPTFVMLKQRRSEVCTPKIVMHGGHDGDGVGQQSFYPEAIALGESLESRCMMDRKRDQTCEKTTRGTQMERGEHYVIHCFYWAEK